MRAYDCIRKKRDGEELTDEEIRYMISSYVKGDMPDYQMSAFLMAVYYQGMTDREISIMTDLVAHSGEMVDLSGIEGVKVDKHSTGGVGDKTTLIVAPMVAACGAKVAKMSGRGLGHTGGTIDKLEAIPGFRTTLTREEFLETVNTTGLSVIGQSGNLAPADKKMYALRDVTATVDSIPLIAASIMGKKLAAGNDSILLDVKTGSGAFMKTLEDSISLARCMVAIGEHAGKRTAALITNMDVPLGHAIGNALEVKEAVETLQNNGPEDLTEVCVQLAGNMLYLAGRGSLEECVQMAEESLKNGNAFRCFLNMVKAQGGDVSCILDTARLPCAPFTYEIKAREDGYIAHMDTEACGIASMMLGAGRETKDSALDYSAGIILKKKPGDRVNSGDVLAVLHAADKTLFVSAEQKILEAIRMSQERPGKQPLIYARVRKDGIEKFQFEGDAIMNKSEILSHVDHTQLKAYASWEDIIRLCQEAIELQTASVCVPPCYISKIRETFRDQVRICTVVGFPLGYSVTEAKVAEVKKALEDGADEIDMVVNICDVKNHDFDAVEQEVKSIREAAGSHILKVIIETCYLTEEEKIRLCEIVTDAGADYIKTSTGFGKAGATLEDIALFKEHIGPQVKMKAAGGIRTAEAMEQYLEAGCDRIGCSSAGSLV